MSKHVKGDSIIPVRILMCCVPKNVQVALQVLFFRFDYSLCCTNQVQLVGTQTRTLVEGVGEWT